MYSDLTSIVTSSELGGIGKLLIMFMKLFESLYNGISAFLQMMVNKSQHFGGMAVN